MASYTPNFNLYKPANSDPHGDFIAEFANNMDIIDAYLGSGGSGGVKILRNQSLSFTGLVATVSDSDITADSNYIVYYHDVTLAENAGITTDASSGTITFTATTAPSNTIVVDIVLLDVNSGGGGSGGHNYSTSERVVGTWIDGKPIYQCTWTGTKSTTADEVVISGLVTLDTLVDSRVIFKGNTGAQIAQYFRDASDFGRCWLDSGAIHMDLGNSYPIRPATWYITLWYTKTTDT